MLREYVQITREWIMRVVTQPRSELDHWQRRARAAYDLFRYGARQLKEDRAPQMAAALAYRTLFAMLPVVVVSSVLYKVFRGVDQLQELVRSLVQSSGLDQVQVIPREATADGPAEVISLGNWIEDLVAKIGNVDLKALGAIGVAVMIYAAVAMIVTIENCFNTVYRASEGRSWMRRLPVYWTVLTLGPFMIGLLFYMDNSVEHLITGTTGWPWVIQIATWIWGISVIWLCIFGLYMLMPHTHVAWRPALIGSLVTAILLQIGKVGMGAYMGNALTLSHLYASIGIVPILMLWVYFMWLAVLFGLEVSATLQMLGGRRVEEMEKTRPRNTGLVDPTAVVLLMEIVCTRFLEGQPTPICELAEEAGLPESTIGVLIDRLVRDGYVHRLDRDETSIALGRPPETIQADELLRIGYELVDESADVRKSSFINSLRDAQTSLASRTTLARLSGAGVHDQVSPQP